MFAIANQGGRNLVEVSLQGEVRLDLESVEEAKAAIELTKLKKRELALAKRTANETERQIRADYTDTVRRHRPALRGGGTLGRVVRGMEVAGHARERQHLANAIAPIEQQKTQVAGLAVAIDRALIKLQEYVLLNK